MQNKENKINKIKPLVGKACSLKSIRNLWMYCEPSAGRYRYYRRNKDKKLADPGRLTPDEVSKPVIVLDERTKRVQIVTSEGRIGWISRFYLASEIAISNTSDNHALSDVAVELVDFMKSIEIVLKPEEKLKAAQIANKLKQLASDLSTTS